MPSLQQFLRKQHVKTQEINYGYLDPNTIMGTRLFLTGDGLEGRRTRSSRPNPQVISLRGEHYCIDGHHKVRRAVEGGESSILCEIAEIDSSPLGNTLMRIASDLIRNLPIR